MPYSLNRPPIKEFLVDGDIEVGEIMRIINKKVILTYDILITNIFVNTKFCFYIKILQLD